MSKRILGILGGTMLAAALLLGTFGTVLAQQGGPGGSGWGPGGMMGGGWGTPPQNQETVSADRARSIAQQWLDANQAGSTTETPDAFYGYYTVHTLKDGKITGMLSVNGYTGQIWYHTWLGNFVATEEADGSGS